MCNARKVACPEEDAEKSIQTGIDVADTFRRVGEMCQRGSILISEGS